MFFNRLNGKCQMTMFVNCLFLCLASCVSERADRTAQGLALISDQKMPVLPRVQAGFYTPPRYGQMWDTWIYYHEGTYYMYYIAGEGGAWDSHELATSKDGVHWEYQKVILEPRPNITWMGTEHVWKSPNFDENGLWVINYSECIYDGEEDSQDIMFATSKDLRNWRKVDESKRFVQDERWYKPKREGRWDCIDVIPGEDGYLYGYFTANPKEQEYPCCDFGFGRSKDGITWEALPPIKGDMHGEFGGLQKIGDKYYILISEGRVGIGDSYKGPFWRQKKNHSIFNGDIYFPRFFHNAPGGPLVNHFYTEGPIFAAPLKDIDIDAEGTLRLVWWQGNNKLKAEQIPVVLASTGGSVVKLPLMLEQHRTYVIEGQALLPGAAQGQELPGILFDHGDTNGPCILFAQNETHYGQAQMKNGSLEMSVEHTVNRDMDYGKQQRFRLVVHNDMAEVYVNEYLTIIKRVPNHGRIGFIRGSDTDGIKNVNVWVSR